MTGFVADKLIPLLVPNMGEIEAAYVEKCIASNWVAYTGPMVREFEQGLGDFTGSKFCVATNTGTSAIHLSLICIGVRVKDLVITTPFSFVAPVNAIKYVGADPIFIDINKYDWQMNPDLLDAFLKAECEVKLGECFHRKSGRRIPCILLIHSLGIPGNLVKVIEIARRYHLKIIEDAACAMGSFYRDKHLGTFGDIGCLSFNGNKVITTSGGGAILTQDAKIAARAFHLSTQAKSSSDYCHDSIGYNYRMTSLCAALGLGQLERVNQFLERKREIYGKYKKTIETISGSQIPNWKECANPNCWLFAAVAPNKEVLMNYLYKSNIEVRTLWMPLSMLPMFSESIFVTEENIALDVFNNCISFPSSTALSNDQQDYILSSIKQYYLTVK